MYSYSRATHLRVLLLYGLVDSLSVECDFKLESESEVDVVRGLLSLSYSEGSALSSVSRHCCCCCARLPVDEISIWD